jgi:PAS domain S-box-containing protein
LVLTISVLYVDDEEALLDLGKQYLERTKEFTVTTTQSASDALNLLKSNGIQAIVSDYQMPEMDGIEFLKKVRATDKNIPFIIFTGKGREEIAIEAFENGADFYIQKGGESKAQFAELSHKIKKAVEGRRADMQVTALNRLYTVLSATNKAIVHIHDKSELLNEICRIVVDIGDFTMAWAGFVNTKKHLIEPVAMSGHIEGYLDTIAISTDDIARGRGPTGTAFRKRTFNVCNDIANDPKMAPWREGALQRGYRSLAAFPFALDTKNAGVITLYASEPGFFTDQIIRLLDEQSGDISFALVTLDHEEQRIAAEKDLKTSELQYRRLFETAQDAILILDGDTNEVIEANKFLLDMLGYPLEYFVGKHLWELGFLKDKSIAQRAFTELKTNGYIRYENIPLETIDGRSFNVEFISNVYRVGDKKIIQCNIRDITHRKVVQDALHEIAHYTRSLLEVSLDPLVTISPEGKITDVNAATEEVTGHSRDYLIGTDFIDYFTDPDKARAGYRKVFDEGSVRDYPLEIRHGNGKITSVLYNARIYRDESGTVKGVFAAARDITDKKKVQDALQESETRYRRLFETAQDAILILNGDTGEIIDANPFIIGMLGYPLEYFVGKHLWELGFIKDKSIAQRAFTELKTNGYIRYEDIPLEAIDGRSINVEFISNLYPVIHQKIIQCNIRDITARKRAEDALRQANKQLNLLSSITRYDILNQLIALKGYLKQSEEVIDNPETLREFIKKEQQAANTIEAQIKFTKDYQELGAVAPAWQNVNASIKKAIAGLPMRDIRVEFDPINPEIFADRLFEKVFYNLIDNAIRYGGDQMKTIRFSSQESDASLMFVCEDDGVGISAEDKKRLFTKGFGKNTGLGLYLSREILAITGITIRENGALGKGARFEITVPRGKYRFKGNGENKIQKNE